MHGPSINTKVFADGGRIDITLASTDLVLVRTTDNSGMTGGTTHYSGTPGEGGVLVSVDITQAVVDAGEIYVGFLTVSNTSTMTVSDITFNVP